VQASHWDLDRVLYAIQLLSETAYRIRSSDVPRILLESALLKLSRWEDWMTLQEILRILQRGAGPVDDAGRKAAAAAPRSAPGGPSRPSRGGRAPARGRSAPASGEPANPRRADAADSAPARLTIEGIRERWADVGAAVRKRGKLSVGNFLGEGKPSRYEDGVLHVAYPEKKKFIAKHLAKDEIRKLLDACTREVLGASIRITPEFARDEPAAPGTEGEPGGAPRPETDPAVKKVIDLFNGRIVGRED
jgi:hypothetical protein